MLPGGTAYNVVAHYSGDGTFAQSDSAPVLVTVSKESSRTTVTLLTFDSSGNLISSNTTTAAYGSPYIMRVDVTNASGTSCSTNLNNGTIPPINTIPCPTGNVSVTRNNGAALNDFTNSNSGVASNVAPLNSQGFFEDQPIQLPGGNHSIVAAYAGDNSYTSSTSAADAISITKAGTGVTMNPIPNASTNFPISLSANVTTASSGVGPAGTMTFSSGGTTLGTAPVIGTAAILTPFAPATGTATFAATFTTAGAKSVTASYSGDSNYLPSGPSAAISVNVTSSGSFNITASPVTVTAGSSGVSTVTVTPTGGFTGSVQVSCAGTDLPPGVSCSPNPLDHSHQWHRASDSRVNSHGRRPVDNLVSFQNFRPTLALRRGDRYPANEFERHPPNRPPDNLVVTQRSLRPGFSLAPALLRLATTQSIALRPRLRNGLRLELYLGMWRRQW